MDLSGTIGGYHSNSYVASIGEAETLLSGTLYTDDWFSASTEQKVAVLVSAARIIDNFSPYYDEKYDDDQTMQFPRSCDYDDEGNLYILSDVKMAQVIQANYLIRIRNLTRQDLQNQGVSSIGLGGLSENYSQSYRICLEAAELLSKYIDIKGYSYQPGNFLS